MLTHPDPSQESIFFHHGGMWWGWRFPTHHLAFVTRGWGWRQIIMFTNITVTFVACGSCRCTSLKARNYIRWRIWIALWHFGFRLRLRCRCRGAGELHGSPVCRVAGGLRSSRKAPLCNTTLFHWREGFGNSTSSFIWPGNYTRAGQRARSIHFFDSLRTWSLVV